MTYKQEDIMKCKLCGGDLVEKVMLWSGKIEKRIKCLNCGCIY